MTLNPWDKSPAFPQRFNNLRDIWAAGKQIDGLGGEWTYQVFVHRVMNFHLPHIPPFWAEPLSGFDALREEVWLSNLASNAGVPQHRVSSITAAFEVFRSVFSATSNEWPMPEEDEQSIGRHSVSIVGVADRDTLLFRNSWAEWPMDFAHGRLTREYIESYATELWVKRPAGYGPRASTIEALAKAVGTPDFSKIWNSPGLRGFEDVGQDLRLRWWESYSVEEGNPGEVLCLVERDQVRVAVAMVIYGHTEATITDLFVWPRYRRLGYASALESIISDRARLRGAHELNMIALDADLIKGRSAVVGFLESRGYDLAEHPKAQVQITGARALA